MKTTANKLSVNEYFKKIDNTARRKDCQTVSAIMKKVTKCKPVMWGEHIVGFDKYTYQRKGSKQDYEFFRTGFSSRKNALVVYIMPGYSNHQTLLDKLGPHTHSGRSCLYIKSLDQIDLKVLEKLIASGYKDMNKQHPK